MTNVRFAQTFLSCHTAVFSRAAWVLLGWCVFLGGCATPTPTPVAVKVPPQLAHLVVLNLTDYEWQISIAGTASEKINDFKLEARASRTLDIPGGDYVIKQTVLSEGAAKELSREIPAKFDPGQVYRWRLVTLLSEPSGVPDSR